LLLLVVLLRFSNLQVLLMSEIRKNPFRSQHEFATAMQDYGVFVADGWIERVFASWKYTHKMGRFKSMLKFTHSNMAYYAAFVIAIRLQAWFQLKFLDEASFDDRSEFLWFHQSLIGCAELRRSHGYAHASRAVQAPGHVNLRARPAVTVTVLTDLTSPNGFVMSAPRTGSNTAMDFLDFVLDLIAGGVSVQATHRSHLISLVLLPFSASAVLLAFLLLFWCCFPCSIWFKETG
jgi:hypothetical protein